MKIIHLHAPWITTSVLAFVIYLLSTPAIETLSRTQTNKLSTNVKTLQSLLTQRDEAEKNIQTVRKLKIELSTESMTALLAPSDRLAIAADIENVAKEFNLNNFKYQISPETPAINSDGTPTAEALVNNTVTIEADFAEDISLRHFLNKIKKPTHGRFSYQSIKIDRIHNSSGDEIQDYNLHAKIEIIWLANSSEKINSTEIFP